MPIEGLHTKGTGTAPAWIPQDSSTDPLSSFNALFRLILRLILRLTLRIILRPFFVLFVVKLFVNTLPMFHLGKA